MIRNYEDKKFAENRIYKLEKILLSLKQKLLPERETQFKAMAAVYVRLIREIREEIEEYTGMEILNVKVNDINIHIEGPIIGYGSAPISIISNYLENFKKTLQNYYMIVNDMKTKRVPKIISELTDFNLNAFQPGSINLSISLPSYQISFFDEQQKLEKVIEVYFNILKWTFYDDETYIKDIDNEIKEKLLINMLRTLPDNRKIDKITFSGRSVNSQDKIIINYNTKKRIKEKIENITESDQMVSVQGCIRGLDLDKLIFVLRDLDGNNVKYIKCKLTNDIVDDMKQYLDSTVIIKGIETKSGMIKVKYIEILD